MLHTLQRSPRSVITCLAGLLVTLHAGVICAQEATPPPAADSTTDADVTTPAVPATKPARPPTTRATPTRAGAKPDAAAGADAKTPQQLRLTRKSRLDPKSPLGMAVEEIRREFERGALRTESNYFTETPCNDLTTDNLFVLLDRKLGATPSVDGYIKWQLLSALPKSLAAQYKPMVTAALNKAPVPEMTAGVITSVAQGQKMEQEVARFNPQQAKAAMEKLDNERDRVHKLNVPILACRSALAGLLDESYDGAMAAFTDAYHRAQAGAEYASAVDKGTQLADAWLKTNPPRDMLQRFGVALVEMRDTKLNDIVAQFDPNDKRGGFDLRRSQRNMDAGGRIRALELELQKRMDTAQNDGQNNQGGRRQRAR